MSDMHAEGAWPVTHATHCKCCQVGVGIVTFIIRRILPSRQGNTYLSVRHVEK